MSNQQEQRLTFRKRSQCMHDRHLGRERAEGAVLGASGAGDGVTVLALDEAVRWRGAAVPRQRTNLFAQPRGRCCVSTMCEGAADAASARCGEATAAHGVGQYD